MKRFITQFSILILLLLHFGCSGIQNRTAFGGGEGSFKITKTDTFNSVITAENLKDLKVSENPAEVKELSEKSEGIIVPVRKFENKIHQMNQKMWFESGKMPQKIVKKSKLLRDYQTFVKSGGVHAKSSSSEESKSTSFLIVGLILGVIGYVLLISPDQGWFGLGFSGSNFNGCFAILIGLALLTAALVLLIIGLVYALSA